MRNGLLGLVATLTVPGLARADWLVVDVSGDWTYDIAVQTLNAEGIPYTVVTPGEIDDATLALNTVVWVPPESVWDPTLGPLMNGGAIDAWVRQGRIPLLARRRRPLGT